MFSQRRKRLSLKKTLTSQEEIIGILRRPPQERENEDLKALQSNTRDLKFFQLKYDNDEQEYKQYVQSRPAKNLELGKEDFKYGEMEHQACCKHMKYQFVPKGECVFEINNTTNTKFYIIIDGNIAVYIRGEVKRQVRQRQEQKLAIQKDDQSQSSSSSSDISVNSRGEVIQKEKGKSAQQKRLQQRDPLKYLEQIKELGKGDIFGEIALLSNKPRSATIYCITNCHFACISKQDYLRIMKQSEDQRLLREMDYLTKFSLFKNLNIGLLKQIHMIAWRKTVSINSQVISQGEQAGSVFLIEQGEFLVTKRVYKLDEKIEDANDQNDRIQKVLQIRTQKFKPVTTNQFEPGNMRSLEHDFQKDNLLVVNQGTPLFLKISQVSIGEMFGEEDIVLKQESRSFTYQCISNEAEIIMLQKEHFIQLIFQCHSDIKKLIMQKVLQQMETYKEKIDMMMVQLSRKKEFVFHPLSEIQFRSILEQEIGSMTNKIFKNLNSNYQLKVQNSYSFQSTDQQNDTLNDLSPQQKHLMKRENQRSEVESEIAKIEMEIQKQQIEAENHQLGDTLKPQFQINQYDQQKLKFLNEKIEKSKKDQSLMEILQYGSSIENLEQVEIDDHFQIRKLRRNSKGNMNAKKPSSYIESNQQQVEFIGSKHWTDNLFTNRQRLENLKKPDEDQTTGTQQIDGQMKLFHQILLRKYAKKFNRKEMNMEHIKSHIDTEVIRTLPPQTQYSQRFNNKPQKLDCGLQNKELIFNQYKQLLSPCNLPNANNDHRHLKTEGNNSGSIELNESQGIVEQLVSFEMNLDDYSHQNTQIQDKLNQLVKSRLTAQQEKFQKFLTQTPSALINIAIPKSNSLGISNFNFDQHQERSSEPRINYSQETERKSHYTENSTQNKNQNLNHGLNFSSSSNDGEGNSEKRENTNHTNYISVYDQFENTESQSVDRNNYGSQRKIQKNIQIVSYQEGSMSTQIDDSEEINEFKQPYKRQHLRRSTDKPLYIEDNFGNYEQILFDPLINEHHQTISLAVPQKLIPSSTRTQQSIKSSKNSKLISKFQFFQQQHDETSQQNSSQKLKNFLILRNSLSIGQISKNL